MFCHAARDPIQLLLSLAASCSAQLKRRITLPYSALYRACCNSPVGQLDGSSSRTCSVRSAEPFGELFANMFAINLLRHRRKPAASRFAQNCTLLAAFFGIATPQDGGELE